jgi:two-component system, OmpR family, phosphate regulon sensor histidine kinase PhoR
MFRGLRWQIFLPYVFIGIGSMLITGLLLINTDGNHALIMVLAAIITVLAILLVTPLIARRATKPLREITQAMRRTPRGQFDDKLKLKVSGEGAELLQALNKMSAGFNQAITSLSQERNKLAAVLTNMADGLLLVDHETRVRLANPVVEKLFGFREEKALGQPFIQVIPNHEIDQLLKQCLDKKQQLIRELETDHSKRFLRIIATPLSSDQSPSVLLIFQDLSEMRRFQTTRRDFISNISHELRTPLASIKAGVETLQDGALEDKSVAGDFLNRMEQEVDHLTQLVGELAELSSIESGRQLEMSVIDLRPLIDDTVSRLQSLAERSGLILIADVPYGLPPARADASRIFQVLMNLIHNAIKFTPPGGRITVSAKPLGDTVVVSVSDTGIGIAPEHLSRIFERFFKADKSRASEGSGLGLAIAKHIVQAHNGEIWVKSEQGKGSTFSFSLPRAK